MHGFQLGCMIQFDGNQNYLKMVLEFSIIGMRSGPKSSCASARSVVGQCGRGSISTDMVLARTGYKHADMTRETSYVTYSPVFACFASRLVQILFCFDEFTEDYGRLTTTETSLW